MKKNLLRLLCMIMAMAMILSLAACGGGSADNNAAPEAPAADEPAADAPAEAPEAPANNNPNATLGDDGMTIIADDGSEVQMGGTLTTYWSEFYNEYDPSVNDNRNFVTFYTDMLWNVDWDGDRTDYNYNTSYLDGDHVAGQIAESWEVADDFSSITVKIREDVTFQDKTAVGIDPQYDVYGGRGVTASDIKYTYDRLMGFEGLEPVRMDQTDWPTNLAMLASVEVLDDYTVKFNLNTSNELAVSNFISQLISICGPEWDELTAEQKADWHYAAGTGPFILTNYVNDNTMTFTKNPNYWDTDAEGNQLPYLDEIRLVHMTDSATMLSSFIAGEIDILAANNMLIDLDQAAQLASSVDSDFYYTASYVGDAPAVCIKIGNNPVEALTNQQVRVAMQYAIDLESISAYKGYTYGDDVGEKSISAFLYGLPLSDITDWPEELVASYTTYDPDLAKSMLEEAGYGDGFEFDVYLFQAQPIDSFQLAAEYLAAVGITMNVIVCATPPEMTAHGADPNDPASMFGSAGMDRISAVPMMIRSDGFMNNHHYSDAEIDALCDQFANATSIEEQVEAAKALDQAYMSAHYLLLVSYGQRWDCYYNARVHGLHGELTTKNYWAGFMFARTWVSE